MLAGGAFGVVIFIFCEVGRLALYVLSINEINKKILGEGICIFKSKKMYGEIKLTY